MQRKWLCKMPEGGRRAVWLRWPEGPRLPTVAGLVAGGTARRAGRGYSMANSFLRVFIWALRRATMEECIWETRDSDRSSVAPISFIVISS